jgi:predicted ABC-type ATPase
MESSNATPNHAPPANRKPLCIIIAGPNGAGKTTFARQFLPRDAGVVHFVNADSIAAGLSPLRPELAALSAGRLYLAEIDRLARARADFAFEATLSGLLLLGRLRRWKAAGYRIEMVFLRLCSPELALRRVAARVRQGGHDVPSADVLRRFARGWRNFQEAYRPLADAWTVYDNSGDTPRLLEAKP